MDNFIDGTLDRLLEHIAVVKKGRDFGLQNVPRVGLCPIVVGKLNQGKLPETVWDFYWGDILVGYCEEGGELEGIRLTVPFGSFVRKLAPEVLGIYRENMDELEAAFRERFRHGASLWLAKQDHRDPDRFKRGMVNIHPRRDQHVNPRYSKWDRESYDENFLSRLRELLQEMNG